MLSNKEKIRYNRHLILPGFGEAAQIKLKNSKVLVVGAGGLGSPVLLYLAASGVGKIGIIDNDTVDLSNLQRQILYNSKEEGKSKVIVAAEKLLALNPEIEIMAIQERLSHNNAEQIMSGYEIVVDCPDNLSTRFLVSDISSKLNIPHVFGAIHQYAGQVCVFNYKQNLTYRKVFSEEPEEDFSNESDKGVLGVLPGITGLIMANETIKILAGIGEVIEGKMLIINTLDMSFDYLYF